jgi:ferric-dicitrate binding protein FerR (iron transport regulator)
MTKQETIALLTRYLNHSCTAEEKLLVDSWYLEISQKADDVDGEVDLALQKALIWQAVMQRRSGNHRIWLIAAAAVATLFVVSITYFSLFSSKEDFPPGGNRATLTLADGKEINLDDVKTGDIAKVPGMTIRKTASGKIVYELQEDEKNSSGPLAYNVIRTPKGGQYQIMLPDSTIIVLNAASSLKYPIHFALSERRVSLIGEAYFEVHKNPGKPFIVESTVQRIQVLGTHFNASCYSNEPAKTTLVEGKVEISQPNNPQKNILKPGEQSTVNPNGITVQQVNVEDAIAWKEGLFVFNQASLKEVLQQIGRWYDVEIDLTQLPDETFSGEIAKTCTLSQVLQAIEKTNNVKLNITGRTIFTK